MSSLHDEEALRLEFLPAGRAVKLRLVNSADRVSFWVSYDMSVALMEQKSPWSKASIVRYPVDVGESTISYHWHPAGSSPVRTPHLHVRTGGDSFQGGVSLDRLHLPTSIVSLATNVRFLITELGVEPNRADWGRVLAGVEATV